MSFDQDRYTLERVAHVSDALAVFCPPDGSQLREAMRYSLLAGGKRLRPLLCIAAAEAVGSNIEGVLPAACALEMIHTFSLIHDDMPAMDDDDLRRGLPTCHVKYGEALAILAGDALHALAFAVAPTHAPLFAQACGQMCQGQAEDLEAEGKSITLGQLQRVHAHKTGALLRASVLAGAYGAPAHQQSSLSHYGECIGMAFQIVDDILDVTGDDATLGKPAGSDLKHDKATYPKLVGLDESKRLARAAEQEALEALEIFGQSAEPLREIARYIVERNT